MPSRSARGLSLAVALVAGALALPSAASAAIAWRPCSPTGFECGSLSVPLDRTGAMPGTVTLEATRHVAAGNTTRTALVALAGGPGQAALPLASDFADVLAPALGSADLLVFDQRGTGASDPLHCQALASGAGSLTSAVDRCAREIGPARAHFTTADSVADIESLRVEGGYDKLILYGVSYGTKVALAYAAAHPANVAGLVLDSVVTPDGPDGLRRSSLQATSRVLGELCAHSECKGITSHATSDVRTLARKLARRTMKGPVYDDRGHRYTATLGEAGLFGILLAGDLNPTLRAEFPGSVRAALTGDVKPILRLSARSAGLQNGAVGAPGWQQAEADSDALFFTTTCEDATSIPWTRGAPVAQRRAEVLHAAKALPHTDTGPFDYRPSLDGIASLCLGYPVAAPPPAPIGPLPSVPTLILDGQGDLRTPVEDAHRVQAQIPGAQLVSPHHTGHSVLGSDFTGCSDRALLEFFRLQPVTQCGQADNEFSPTPKPPKSLDGVKAYPHTKGKAGRTVEAVRATVNDANRQLIGEALALGATPSGAGGLRGGYVRPTVAGFVLRNYQYVPGVQISGSVPDRGTAKLRVRGSKAARGSLRVTSNGIVTGTLGGRRIRASFATAARARPELTIRQAVARGRLIAAAG